MPPLVLTSRVRRQDIYFLWSFFFRRPRVSVGAAQCLRLCCWRGYRHRLVILARWYFYRSWSYVEKHLQGLAGVWEEHSRPSPARGISFHPSTLVLVGWFQVSFVGGCQHFAPVPMFLFFFRFSLVSGPLFRLFGRDTSAAVQINLRARQNFRW